MKEKRIKLGVDVQGLGNQLIEINNLTEQNYRASIRGQEKYNEILNSSLKLLDKKVEKLKSIQDIINGFRDKTIDINLNNQDNKKNDSNSNTTPNSDKSNVDNGTIIEVISFIQSDISDIKGNEESLTSLLEKSETWLQKISKSLDTSKENISNSNQKGNTIVGVPPITTSQAASNANVANKNNEGVNAANLTSSVANQTANLANQKNDVYMLVAATSAIPIIGEAIKSILTRLIQAAENITKNRALFYGASGHAPLSGFENIGLSDAEAYQKEVQYVKANANFTRGDLAFERGFGLGTDTITSLLTATRRDTSDLSSSSLGANFLSNMTAMVPPREVRAYSEDYLKILVDVNRKQLETIGYTNSLINTDVVKGIANLSSDFRDPILLQRVVGGIRDALTQANSPQLEALQLTTLSEMFPDSDLWELEKMREDPFQDMEGSKSYLSEYIKKLSQMGGNKDDILFNLSAAFPELSKHQVEYLYNGYKAGRLNISRLRNREDFSVEAEANRATSSMQKHTAFTENLASQLGQPAMNAAIDVQDKLSKGALTAIDWVKKLDIGSEIKTFSNGISEFTNSIKNFSKSVSNFIYWMTHWGKSRPKDSSSISTQEYRNPAKIYYNNINPQKQDLT